MSLRENLGTEFDAALEAARLAAQPRSPVEGRPPGTPEAGIPYVILGAGQTVRDLEHLLPSPARVRAAVAFEDAASFGRYVKDWKGADITQLFASPRSRSITAQLDYHGDVDTPSWCDHTATLALPLSTEWLRWTSQDGKSMTQAAFAEFLEDNLPDIAEPEGAEVMQAAQHLEAKKSVAFKSGINLTNGAAQLTYDEQVESKGRGSITIPTRFVLGVPVFERGKLYRLAARLRYRIHEDRLTFAYHLDRPHKVLEGAFSDVLEEVQKATGLEALLGSVKA